MINILIVEDEIPAQLTLKKLIDRYCPNSKIVMTLTSVKSTIQWLEENPDTADVIFMDGGRGQVNVALQVLEELKLNIPVCGMVKDDKHHTRGLYYNNEIIPIDTHGEAFKLITRIQDETHRFAIEYHRSLRAKGQVHSILDDIKGIGPARRKALMKHFNSIDEIKNSDIDTLARVPSMDVKSAKAVVDFFLANKDEKV